MICELCDRDVSQTDGHHLIPRKFLKREFKIRRHGKIVGEKKLEIHKHNNKSFMCVDCSKTVHALLTLKQLAKTYNTVETLKQCPQIRKYVAWVRNKPEGIVKHPKRMWKGE